MQLLSTFNISHLNKISYCRDYNQTLFEKQFIIKLLYNNQLNTFDQRLVIIR